MRSSSLMGRAAFICSLTVTSSSIAPVVPAISAKRISMPVLLRRISSRSSSVGTETAIVLPRKLIRSKAGTKRGRRWRISSSSLSRACSSLSAQAGSISGAGAAVACRSLPAGAAVAGACISAAIEAPEISGVCAGRAAGRGAAPAVVVPCGAADSELRPLAGGSCGGCGCRGAAPAAVVCAGALSGSRAGCAMRGVSAAAGTRGAAEAAADPAAAPVAASLRSSDGSG